MGVSDFLARAVRAHFPFEPTPDQERLFDTLSRFAVSAEPEDILVVNGYAGTGKTSAVGAFVRTLKEFGIAFRLAAPTGRAAKVLTGYTGERSQTVHKLIYRQKSLTDGVGVFSLNLNKAADTLFIVDEASLIAGPVPGSPFGSGDLLADLVEFVRNGTRNRLILIGDQAQLPPVSLDRSPALDTDLLRNAFGCAEEVRLSAVVRQAAASGILYNATLIRRAIEAAASAFLPEVALPPLETAGFTDIERIGGGDLIERISESMDRYGPDETVVLCRSNRRANRYNAGIRSTVLYREEQLNRGDKVMIVKNCYQFLEDVPGLDFIANGDVAELLRIGRYEERYGLHFAEAELRFPDYGDAEITARIILDTLMSESPSLSPELQRQLYEGVWADYEHLGSKRKIGKAVREDPYYNALQIKYAAAITCHKSQGGQWKAVFVDNPCWNGTWTAEDLKWLYTAVTRGTEKVFLVNFRDEFFKKP